MKIEKITAFDNGQGRKLFEQECEIETDDIEAVRRRIRKEWKELLKDQEFTSIEIMFKYKSDEKKDN